MAEKTPAGTSVEKKDPTLKEILDDKEQGAKFNVWLESQDQGPLVAKVIAGKFEKADMGILAAQREAFLKRQKENKEMRDGVLDAETLKRFTESSDELKQVSDLIGEDGLREMLVSVMDDYMVNRDEETKDPLNQKKRGDLLRHKVAFDIFVGWKKSKEALQAKETEQKEYLKNFKLNREETEAISQITDIKERRKQIELRMTEKGFAPEGTESEWLFWKKPAWSDEQKKLIDQAAVEFSDKLDSFGDKTKWILMQEELAKVRQELETAEKGIANNLNSIATNDGIKEIGRILNSEKKPKNTSLSFAELKQEIERVKKPEAIEKEFFDYAEEEFNDYVTSNNLLLTTPAFQGTALDGFYKQFKGQLPDAANSKGGIWKALYDTLVAPMIGPFLDECLSEIKSKGKMEIDPAKKTLKKKK